MEIKKITYKEEGQTKKIGRPKKPRELTSQANLILSILQHNTNHDGTRRNSFTELELTRVIGSYNSSYDWNKCSFNDSWLYCVGNEVSNFIAIGPCKQCCRKNIIFPDAAVARKCIG